MKAHPQEHLLLLFVLRGMYSFRFDLPRRSHTVTLFNPPEIQARRML
jgi:hypothetical protein